MSNIKWNEAQLAAISYSGQNLLLSAAAGSGKTATLTERIISLLKDPSSDAELSSMLVVTFTNEAAAELKQRIGAALSAAIAENPEDRRLVRQLTALDGAAISTIHSFLLKELKPYFARLSLPPEFSVADEAYISEMKRELMLDTVNDCFDGKFAVDDFTFLADCLSGARDDEALDASLLKLYNSLTSLGLSADFLMKDSAACDFLLSDAGYPVLKKINCISDYYSRAFCSVKEELLQNSDTERYAANAEQCALSADSLKAAAAKGYSTTKSCLEAFKLPSLPPLKTEKQTEEYVLFKNLRSSLTDEARELYKQFFKLTDEELQNTVYQNSRVSRAAGKVLAEFERRFTCLKQERGKVDFSDIEKYAAELFCGENGEPTDAAKAVGSRFEYVFIDEYQDTNRLQDAIFSALFAHGRRFMVGDVKQSVYGFRGACPDIFCKYRALYEKKNGGEAIFMSENHRSAEAVTDFANLVSDYIFPGSPTPFEAEDRLICAKADKGEYTPVQLCLVEAGDEDCANPEAEYTARRIARLLNGERLCGGEDVRPGDIAILLRSGARAKEFKAALEKKGIPVKNNATEDFFSYSEVQLLLCLLCTVDNPMRDIYLAGVMKSPLFNFSLDDLVRLRGADKRPLWYSVRQYANEAEDALAQRLRAFINKLDEYREAARAMTAEKLLYLLISDTGYLALYDESGTGRLKRSVRTLYSHALACGRQGGGLHELIIYLKGLMQRSDAKEPDSGADAVTIITTHRSKGLEYPVCFLCDTASEFNFKNLNDTALLDAENGLFSKLTDPSGLVKCDTPLRLSARLKAKERQIDEEMRILYVALTRARELLFITLKCADAKGAADASRKRLRFGRSAYTVYGVKSPGMWLLDAAVNSMGHKSFRLEAYTVNREAEPFAAAVPASEGAEAKELKELLCRRFEFTYPAAHLADIPAKLPVSGLSEAVLDEKIPDRAPRRMTVPYFMSDISEKSADPAAAGTATHMFLQFCDFENLLTRGAEAEKNRLTAEGFITGEAAELVRLDEIELFAASGLLRRIMSAKMLYRELRFNAMLPAHEFTKRPELRDKLISDGTRICVQGVVDCLFKDSDGRNVLVDYKTDRLSERELRDRSLAEALLAERHKRQLYTYKRLCGEMLGEEIHEVLIYSLPLGDTIQLTEGV